MYTPLLAHYLLVKSWFLRLIPFSSLHTVRRSTIAISFIPCEMSPVSQMCQQWCNVVPIKGKVQWSGYWILWILSIKHEVDWVTSCREVGRWSSIFRPIGLLLTVTLMHLR